MSALRLLHAQAGNLIMALCAAISALMGLGHVDWWWLGLVAAAWLVGYRATNPADRPALPLARPVGTALFYIFGLIGTAICYVIGLAVSTF
ncbi:hypothetical protein [Acidisoma silvae]|uniref:Uncharacterized protein n=1 Tax=Acidisoma silvae TaxID=2802396 RepID=A0A964E184_9PROT|nr:hypothetical protein [Acidisoma silvae]MCB8877949.1 hypothetical protein [Acidisoma silvae]